jgi:predicted phage baseplate assembly protein
MLLPQLNMDDRRWTDLVEEGLALIPIYAPELTDHNIHDPLRTLLELFAWIAEMDLYQVNQVPERHRRKFLALVGIYPWPPRPARTVMSLGLPAGAASVALPPGVEFEGDDPFEQPTRFRALEQLTVAASRIEALYTQSASGLVSLTDRWQRGEPLRPFGEDPRPGAAFYLQFPGALPTDARISLFFTVADLQESEAERKRLLQEINAQRAACRPPDSALTCPPGPPPGPEADPPLSHHSVRTVWEFPVGPGVWQRLEPARGEVEDQTRAFTLNGRVLVKLPRSIVKTSLGPRAGGKDPEQYYLRCRFVAGAYDAAPTVRNLVLNGVMAEQATPPDTLTITMPGSTDVKTRLLGRGTGAPFQQVTAAKEPETEAEQAAVAMQTPVVESSFRLFTEEGGTWLPWARRADFDVSTRGDAHYLLDPTLGVVTFGDGERGRVVPPGVPIFAAYLATRAEAGNLGAGTVTRLADSAANRDLLLDFSSLKGQLERITNPAPATGGAAAETLAHAEGRAAEALDHPQRAVTLADYEALAMKTPGVRLARVAARANLHAGFPCFKAPGIITLIILPFLPADRPMPVCELRRVVAAYLARRRVIGTRVEVVGPTYLEVSVRAKIHACRGTSAPDLRQRVTAALNRFFHPLTGGPDGTGWPFGRDVYRSEVLQVIDETEGVDHVHTLELIADGGEPQCGNVCLSPTGLVAAGRHQIEVV